MATTTPAHVPDLDRRRVHTDDAGKPLTLTKLVASRFKVFKAAGLSYKTVAARAGRTLDNRGKDTSRLSDSQLHSYATIPLWKLMPSVDKMMALADALSDPAGEYDGVIVSVADIAVAAAASLEKPIYLVPAPAGGEHHVALLGERTPEQVRALEGAASDARQ